MEAFNKVLDWEMHVATGYIIGGIIAASAFAFACVCGGIFLLRISKPNQEQQNVPPKLPLSQSYRPESSHSNAVSRQPIAPQQSPAANNDAGKQDVSDKRYWPPSVRRSP